MEAKGYNGWTNYETWAVQLHIDNDNGTQRYWSDEARDIWRRSRSDVTFTRRENAILKLESRLKEEHDTAANDLLDLSPTGAGILGDLLRAALSEVNYHEIAKHMIDAAEYGDSE